MHEKGPHGNHEVEGVSQRTCTIQDLMKRQSGRLAIGIRYGRVLGEGTYHAHGLIDVRVGIVRHLAEVLFWAETDTCATNEQLMVSCGPCTADRSQVARGTLLAYGHPYDCACKHGLQGQPLSYATIMCALPEHLGDTTITKR